MPASSADATAGGGGAAAATAAAPAGHVWVRAPLQGQIVETADGTTAAVGARVRAGDAILVLLSMKMEHVINAPGDGVVASIAANPSDQVLAGAPLLLLKLDHSSAGGSSVVTTAATSDVDADTDVAGNDEESSSSSNDPTAVRADLSRVLERRHITTDAGRATLDPNFTRKVNGRHGRGQRTARENIADLVDPSTFVEYGRFAIAAQKKRREVEDLRVATPADGMVCGLASVNGDRFTPTVAKCVVMAYDYLVLAGTQGKE